VRDAVTRRSSVDDMTQVLSPNDVEIRDFTTHIDVRFRIDDDVFVGVPNIPGFDLMKFGAMVEGLSEREIMGNSDYFSTMFRLVLNEESADLFLARMGDKRRPISMPQVMEIMPWLMESYGMRPPTPSSESSGGSETPGDGTSSTASGSAAESTSEPFPRNAS
jgi:hypothetical protein